MKQFFTLVFLLSIHIILFVSEGMGSVKIDGFVLLENSNNHSNIEITFERIEPSKGNYKYFSQENGFYGIDVEEGIYNLQFKKSNHETILLTNQLFFEDKTLDTLTMKFIGLSGTISGRLTKGIYNIVGKLSLNTGDTLIIDPGVILKFKENVSFEVYGTIFAKGSEEDSIIFTRYDDSTAWGGINLYNQTKESIISYSVIEHCKKYGLSFGSSQLSLENTEIRNNSVKFSELGTSAIFLLNASRPYIKNCVIRNNNIEGYKYDNSLGGGVYMCQFSNAVFENTIICNNSANHGGGVCIFDSNPIFRNVLIYGNKANIGGGIQLLSYDYTLENATIVNNTAEFGAGISSGGDLNKVNNCIIAFNNGWGVEGSSVKNSSVFGNTPDNFRNCNEWCGVSVKENQNGDSVDVFGNLIKDPLFIDYLNNNFKLQYNSSCIDAGVNENVFSGNDFDGNVRIWDGNNDGDSIVDIGAYEFNSEPIKQMVSLEEHGFESGLGNWSITGINQNYSCDFITESENVFKGTKSLKISNSINENKVYLISPEFKVPEKCSTFISFFAKIKELDNSLLKRNELQNDDLTCRILVSESGIELNNFENIKNSESDIYDSWVKFSGDLNHYQGKNINIAIEFSFNSIKNAVLVDDISIKSTQSNTSNVEQDYEDNLNIVLYPNPVNNKILIQNLPDYISEISIFNEYGQMLKRLDYIRNEDIVNIRTDELTNGIYFLRILMNSEVCYKKFVVLR